MADLICPNCGSKVILPEHSSICCGETLSKESNGTYYLNMETKGENKMENSTLFASLLSDLTTGKISQQEYAFKMQSILNATEDDEVTEQIKDSGVVNNSHLYRRWVMAQFFRIINTEKDIYHLNFDEAIRKRYSFRYQFNMMINECHALAKLEREDKETFEERKRFFNKDVFAKICNEYADMLQRKIDRYPERNCRDGENVLHWKNVFGKKIWVKNIEKEVIAPYRRKASQIKFSKDYRECEKYLREFTSMIHTHGFGNEKMPTWIECFKGAGAYYTLQNMVLYHGCKLVAAYSNETYKGMDAYVYMKIDLKDYLNYEWVGLLRATIKANNFTFGK